MQSDTKAYVTEDGIVVRATQSGEVDVTLAYGCSRKIEICVPDGFEITNWDLTVESWTEGEEIFRTDTFTDTKGNVSQEHTISTVKTKMEGIKLEHLKTWDEIPEIGRAVSGKGYYCASFLWDGEADGAYIDFGTLVMSMEVVINGKKTGDVNMNAPVLDVGKYLVKGENTIELYYSSHMQNAVMKNGGLKETEPGKWTSWPGYRIDWCKYGPSQAMVIPYVEETIPVLDNSSVALQVEGKTQAEINTEAVYEIAVSGAQNLATATLTIATEGLTAPMVHPAEGWMTYSQTEENGVLTVVMGNLNGVSGEATIATVTGAVKTIGTAFVKVTKAVLSSYVAESETYVHAVLDNAYAETAVSYSVYDVNRDGRVDQLDITRAQRSYGTDNAQADVNGDGVVNITDFILILNNYTA